jgi:hypothetical protein
MRIPGMITTCLLATLPLAPQTVTAGEGFYVGASIGSGKLDDDFDGLKIDSDATAYRINGGWQANRFFGLELGYQSFGDFQQKVTLGGTPGEVRLSADGYTLGIIARYPVWNDLDLLGRVGAFFWDGEAEINSVSQADPGDTNPYFSAGLAYNVTPAFSVNGDWTRYELASAGSDVFSIGLQYRFGR